MRKCGYERCGTKTSQFVLAYITVKRFEKGETQENCHSGRRVLNCVSCLPVRHFMDIATAGVHKSWAADHRGD